MSVYDLLACPACRIPVVLTTDRTAIVCAGCGRQYPVINGVPVLLLDPEGAFIGHEHELPMRPGYARWKERLVLKSLTDAQVALDFGAGNQAVDDPCILRMDLVLGPNVDVVGDVHALPFRDACIDFAFGGAVMEHLPRPHQAADEIYRVLRPGGLVYADWNFIIAYHGYPHHYFNATLHGIKETFRQFTELELAVGPYHGAAFALRSVLETYLRHFEPATMLEEEFAERMRHLLWYPLDDFDRRIPDKDRFRVAVSGYILGAKQPMGGESIIPQPVMAAWSASAALRTRYLQPLNLSLPDNLMAWAKQEGRQVQAIADYFAALRPFSKRGDVARYDRSVVESWPWELMDRVDQPPDTEAHRGALWFSRPLSRRVRESWRTAGLAGVGRCLWWSVKRTGQELRNAARGGAQQDRAQRTP